MCQKRQIQTLENGAFSPGEGRGPNLFAASCCDSGGRERESKGREEGRRESERLKSSVRPEVIFNQDPTAQRKLGANRQQLCTK